MTTLRHLLDLLSLALIEHCMGDLGRWEPSTAPDVPEEYLN